MENRGKGINSKLAEWIQIKLEEKIREKGTTAVCADGNLLATACAGSSNFGYQRQ